MTRLSVCLLLLAAASPIDIEVDLDPGRPFDFIKVPLETPTGGRIRAESGDRPNPGSSGGPGHTSTGPSEKEKKKSPPPAPSGLTGPKAPSTRDWKIHKNWNPNDETVEWKDGQPAPTPTGPSKPKDPGIWTVKNYPPKVDMELYTYCVTRYLQVQLHRAQVSESEITQFLIELGYPAYYSATACKNEGDLKGLTGPVMRHIGPMVRTPPRKPSDPYHQKVYLDLISAFPYQAEFGRFILSEPSGKTVPVLLHILKNERHPFLLRNTAFILRCFNNIEVREPMLEKLEKTRDAVVRNRLLVALMRWGHPGAARWCAKYLKRNDTFRTMAAWAIGRIALANPIDARVIDQMISASKNVDIHGEMLLSVVPALGQIGRHADKETRAKIEKRLRRLLKNVIPLIKNPPSRGGTGPGMVPNPDPVGVRAKILTQRIRMALALVGSGEDVAWAAGAQVHISNRVLLAEVRRLTGNKP